MAEKKLNFSQRMGLAPASKAIQRESMDDDLRNTLWNVMQLNYWGKQNSTKYTSITRLQTVGIRLSETMFHDFFNSLYIHHFKEPIDTLPEYYADAVMEIRKRFFLFHWDKVYRFIEFIANNKAAGGSDAFVADCNVVLERESSAYRFINRQLVEIVSGDEIKAIEDAISSSSPYPGVQEHLNAALRLMSDRKAPDYRNSIKESISAIESLARQVTSNEKATLSDALKELEKSGKIHGALKGAFDKLYGYTSDEGGIRHCMLDESELSSTEARFMLVACSAFVNYFIDKTSKR